MEDVQSFPAVLPPGERVLWQGRPCWRTLGRRAFHLRKLAVYFAVLLALYVVSVVTSGETGADAARSIGRMTAVALTPLGLIALYAWLSSRAALYTITNRRVILRCGIAMPITFNLPFARIDRAELRLFAGGAGSIALTLTPPDRLAYFALWPHARPWRLARAEPMLRCVADAERVAQVLGRALAGTSAVPVRVSAEESATSVSPRPHAAALA